MAFNAPLIYLESIPIKQAVSRASNPFIRGFGKLTLDQPGIAKALGKLIPPLQTLTEYSGWPRNTITGASQSDEAVMQALKTGPYGRCVYRCDNNVVEL